jgi:5-methylcytosine-specific restriction enzyme A
MNIFVNPIIDLLRPTEHQTVMRLVEESGIDVSDWANYNGKSPASNPKYCYEWVFSERQMATACLWHNNLKENMHGQLTQHLNLWNVAKKHEQGGTRSVVAKRARKLDLVLQEHFNRRSPLRVIIVDGEQADLENQDVKSSKVSFRLLDPEPWHVDLYDFYTGDCLLIRVSIQSKFIDQFEVELTVGADVHQAERTTTVYSRSASVRNAVLERASGHCEYCGIKGFSTASGQIYLETHHITPLHKGGADNTSNVVALCPQHHREAHFGARANEISEAFFQRMSVRT